MSWDFIHAFQPPVPDQKKKKKILLFHNGSDSPAKQTQSLQKMIQAVNSFLPCK